MPTACDVKLADYDSNYYCYIIYKWIEEWMKNSYKILDRENKLQLFAIFKTQTVLSYILLIIN